MTYALTQSFSYASYRIGHAPSSHITPYVPVTGVPNPQPLKTRNLEASTLEIECHLA